MDIISQEELEKIRNGDLMEANKILLRVVSTSVEQALRTLPRVVTELIKTSTARKKMGDKYLSDNPTFVDHPSIVQQLSEKIESENPGLSADEVLAKARPRIEEAIALSASKSEFFIADKKEM